MSFARSVRVTARWPVQLSVLAALVASLVVVPGMSAEAVTRPRTLYQERPVSTGAAEPGFPIDHVGVVFDLPPGADVDHGHGDDEQHAGTEGLAVRVRTEGRWGPWQHVIEDGAQAAGQWTGALVSAGDAEAYQVRGIPAFARNARAAALNTTDGPQEVIGYRPAGSAEAVTSCRSRTDWGADESIRTSDRSYAPVQMMTVHHTATQNDDPDPDARVRAIYEYHVKTNRWDDIGYQALISEDGTVYEGRWSGSDSPSCLTQGGHGWEFGHAGTAVDADMVTGAHTGGYNTGNFGVALLGTLTDVAPKAGARTALVEYLAELADRHGIQADGEVYYDNGTNAGTFDAISGHRDFTATECPGGTLYADLPDLRTEVAATVAGNATPNVTITSPTDADSFTVAESTAGAGVSITFAASATDDSTSLTWHWTQDGHEVATTSSFTATYAVGTYTFDVYATDTEGAVGHDSLTVTVDPPVTYVDDVSSGEHAVTGTVSGTYVDTHADGGATETISEVDSGSGPPPDRHSLLEHVWTVPVTGGPTVTLSVDATASNAGDGDDFAFAYSLDGGATYTTAVTVPAGASGTYSTPLPATTQGTVHIRVRDTNRAKGTRDLDSIAVDHLFIRSETSETTPVGSDITLSASGRKVKGQHHVDLSWSGATSVRIYRDGSFIADVDGSTHTDAPGGSGKGQYTYWVCALDSTEVEGACSNEATVTFS